MNIIKCIAAGLSNKNGKDGEKYFEHFTGREAQLPPALGSKMAHIMASHPQRPSVCEFSYEFDFI